MYSSGCQIYTTLVILGLSLPLTLPCSLYIPKAHSAGVLTSPSYPYPEYSVQQCQYVFDMYTPRPQLNSMVCLTFQNFSLPSQYVGACSKNYIQFGVTKGAIICGSMDNLTIQYIGGTGVDASVNSNVKVNWPTICYSDSHVLEVLYSMGREVQGGVPGQQLYFATYQQFMFPIQYQCDVPIACDGCSGKMIQEHGICPTCICPTNYTASVPLPYFGCNFTQTYCSIVPDRHARWRLVKAYTPPDVFHQRRGPSHDHTHGKFFSNPLAGYMYLAEIEMSRGERASLFLPSETINTTHCIQFWYYMRGSHVGRLDLLIDGHVAWFREGDQGDAWWRGQVLFLPWIKPGTEQYAQQSVEFRGRALHQSPDFGGIAVDDISLYRGECVNRVDISCTFETGLCGWTADGSVDVRSGGVPDNTENRFTRNLLQVSASLSHQAVLTSPYVTERVTSQRCLTFWHYARILEVLVTVYVKLVDSIVPFSQKIGGGFWIKKSQWTKVELPVAAFRFTPTAYQVELRFLGTQADRNATVLLDDIQVTETECNSSPPVPQTTVEPACPYESQLRCEGGRRECIYENELCDGKLDCSDGWDELRERCTCPLGMFRCLRGECIRSEYRCDNIIHCRDGSDEASAYARCNEGPALSVGAIIGSSFGVMCLCVLLITLCAWGCVYAKNRRLNQQRRYTPRRARSLGELGLDPYVIDCPEAPPSYFSVVNYGFEPPVEPPPSYESVVAAGTVSPQRSDIQRLSLTSLGLAASFRELLARASISSMEGRPSQRSYSERTDMSADPRAETPPTRRSRTSPIGGNRETAPSLETTPTRIDNSSFRESPLQTPVDSNSESSDSDSPPSVRSVPPPPRLIQAPPPSIETRATPPEMRIPPLPPRGPPPLRLNQSDLSDVSDVSSELSTPEARRQPSWRLAVARRLSEAAPVPSCRLPDVINDATAASDTYV